MHIQNLVGDLHDAQNALGTIEAHKEKLELVITEQEEKSKASTIASNLSMEKVRAQASGHLQLKKSIESLESKLEVTSIIYMLESLEEVVLVGIDALLIKPIKHIAIFNLL